MQHQWLVPFSFFPFIQEHFFPWRKWQYHRLESIESKKGNYRKVLCRFIENDKQITKSFT
jgi:hypothetical protein